MLINGRPPSINALAQQAGAILEGFYLGQEGGAAVAAVLFGDVNPGGKLPVSFARSAGHLPVFYNHKPSARRGYLFDDVTPLYPFGHGLSYTTFGYKNLKVTPAPTKDGQRTRSTVSVEVTNAGQRAGDEVVQLYLRDVVSSVTRPVKELKGFQRVTLKPGETKTVVVHAGARRARLLEDGARLRRRAGQVRRHRRRQLGGRLDRVVRAEGGGQSEAADCEGRDAQALTRLQRAPTGTRGRRRCRSARRSRGPAPRRTSRRRGRAGGVDQEGDRRGAEAALAARRARVVAVQLARRVRDAHQPDAREPRVPPRLADGEADVAGVRALL